MKSLKLKKEVIANLNQAEMNNIEGGLNSQNICYTDLKSDIFCYSDHCVPSQQVNSFCKCDM